MSTYINTLFILIFVSLSKAASDLETPNSKAFFKPTLKYLEKDSTGITFLRLKTEDSSQKNAGLNNPFFGRQNFILKGRAANTEWCLKYEEDLKCSNRFGKIRLAPIPAGTQSIQLNDSPYEYQLNLGEKLLVLFVESRSIFLPPLIQAVRPVKQMENLEFEDLLDKLNTISQNLDRSFNKKSLPFIELISPEYRDESGKQSDFAEFLEVHAGKMKELVVRSFLFSQRKEKGGILELRGSYKAQEQIHEFSLRLELDPELRLLSWKQLNLNSTQK
jgi:hypothetical protein